MFLEKVKDAFFVFLIGAMASLTILTTIGLVFRLITDFGINNIPAVAVICAIDAVWCVLLGKAILKYMEK